MEGQNLTFTALDAKIEWLEMSLNQDDGTTPTQRRLMLVGLLATVLATLAAKVLPISEPYTLVLVGSLFVIEIVSLTLGVFLGRKAIFQSFSTARRMYANELDVDLPRHGQLIDWLRTFPDDQLKALQNFAEYRHGRLKARMPLLIGAVENMGFLPVLIAVFLQVKDFHSPLHISWITIVAIPVLSYFYWLGLSEVSVRLRVQLYQTLLHEAADAPPVANADEQRSLVTSAVG